MSEAPTLLRLEPGPWALLRAGRGALVAGDLTLRIQHRGVDLRRFRLQRRAHAGVLVPRVRTAENRE